MTKEIENGIKELPPEQQEKVQNQVEAIRSSLTTTATESMLALAIVLEEVIDKAEKEELEKED